MQITEHQKYRCPKCAAAPGAPCLTMDGREAAKVHWGRPVGGPHARRAEATLQSSPLRPSASAPGIWIGSEFVSRDVSVPYGVWYCRCGASLEALSVEGVAEMNRAYADHAGCRFHPVTPRAYHR